jgi:hypothetical protein
MEIINDYFEEQSRKMKIRIVIEKCVLWGCDINVISNTYDLCGLSNTEQLDCNEITESETEAKGWLEMDRTEWIGLEYISKDKLDEYKQKTILTETERKEKAKYYELMRYGYSDTIYKKYIENGLLEELYDTRISQLENDNVEAQNTYNKSKYLMLYKVKKYYDFIYKTGFTNTENAKDTEFLKYRKQSYYFYVVFNVFEMFIITYENIAEFLEDSSKEFYIEKTAENYKKLLELYEYVKPTIDFLKANDKSNEKIRSKTENIADFKKITILLEKPFFHFGMKIQMGRAKPTTKREKNINIFMNGKQLDKDNYIQYSYRVQEKAYKYNNNETDDIVRLQEEDTEYDADTRHKIRLCNYGLWNDTHNKLYKFITNGDNYKLFITEIEGEIRKGEIDNDYTDIDFEEQDIDQDTDLYGNCDY